MALPLNVFKTITKVATASTVGIYTAVKNLAVAGNDSIDLLFGKLVLESGDVIQLSADSTSIKFIGSVLETLN